jgi:hypothetical protein
MRIEGGKVQRNLIFEDYEEFHEDFEEFLEDYEELK